MSENTKTALLVAALFILYGIVGRMDYDDQVAAEQARHIHIATNGVQK